MKPNYSYQTEQFQYTIVNIKGEKKHYIEGYISTIDKDDANEVVTMKAQRQILEQVNQKIITMDLDHQEWIAEDGSIMNKPKNEKIPVAKIVHAELREKGVWVKAEINKNSPSFNDVWGSIKDRFLHSFSIAFYPIKAVTKAIQGIETIFIDALNLINVTLTGSPVNSGATFNPVMKAAIKNVNKGENMEGENTPAPPAEEKKVEEQKPEGQKEETKPEEPKEEVSNIEALKKEAEDLKKTVEDQNKELADLKEKLENTETEKKEEVEEAKAEGPLAQVKSLKGLVAKNAEMITAIKAKLEAPIMKAKVEKLEKNLEKDVDPLQRI